MKKATRSLLLVTVATAMLLLLVFAPRHESIAEPNAFQMRDLLASAESSGPASSATSAAAETSSTQAATSATPTSSAAATPSSTPVADTTSTSAAHSSSVPSSTTATAGASSAAPYSTVQPISTVVPTTATNSLGQVVTSYVTYNPTTSSAVPSETSSSSDSSSSGLGTGSIIGLSVAGGIAAIALGLFFVWKFTRKRFTDFDDNEAIKWPELNAHNNDVHALPTNSTGRAGFGAENVSDVNLTRAPSPGGTYANSIAASSVPEVYGTGQDPYAVPPLPHLNPNQPYRDDPNAYAQPAGYYDPYRGPVPNTFTDTISDGHGAESIPMTQMARTRSPGPQMAYDVQGRASPAPQAAVGYAGVGDRSGTPNPAALAAGRASPSPAYGYGTR